MVWDGKVKAIIQVGRSIAVEFYTPISSHQPPPLYNPSEELATAAIMANAARSKNNPVSNPIVSPLWVLTRLVFLISFRFKDMSVLSVFMIALELSGIKPAYAAFIRSGRPKVLPLLNVSFSISLKQNLLMRELRNDLATSVRYCDSK